MEDSTITINIEPTSSIPNLKVIQIRGSFDAVTSNQVNERVWHVMQKENVNIVFISQSSSENNITFGIDIEDSMKVSFLLRNSDLFGKQWFSIKIDNDVSLIAVIGSGMLHTPGVAGKIFTTLGNNGINVRSISQGSSELNITFIIERDDCKKAVNVLYDAFIN